MPSANDRDFTPALRLLLASMRAPLAAPAPTMPDLAGIDWDFLLRAAAHHGLTPLLHRLLTQSGAAPPPEANARLAARAQAEFRHNLLLAAESKRVLALFADAGISAIAFKGPALAQEIYGTLALRPSTDLDLLIFPENLERAIALLRSFAYAPDFEFTSAQWRLVLRNEEEVALTRPPGLHLELHWRVAPRQFALEWNLAAAWPRCRSLILCDLAVKTLAPADLLLALSIHGAKHGWERLIWLCDIALLLRRYPELDWPELAAAARNLGAGRLLATAIALAAELAGINLPEALRSQAQEPAAQSLISNYVAWLSASLRSPPAGAGLELPALRRHAFALRSRERRRDRWRYLWWLLTLPTAQELASLRLPRALHPLYAAVRAGSLLLHPLRAALRARPQPSPTGEIARKRALL